ncbi:MAG: hypothetical protein U9R38_03150 [Candidatus Margulisiibacteriota bacterium]|nr:hypothetical protein [Candidatus Margulisiibacteriota bacterium]
MALKIADMLDENYSNLQGHGKKGMLLSLGFFQEEGGCCRHRAADMLYVVDPNKGIRGERRELDRGEDKTMRGVLISRGIPAENLEFYKVIDERNGGEEWYFVERDKFNVVWRRREASKP